MATDNPDPNYWIAAVIFIGYILLSFSLFTYKRKKVLEERGRTTNASIIKKWTIHTDKGKQYKLKYEFQVYDNVITSTATVCRNEWNRYNIFDKIEIIFDP
eukprot:24084_1